MGAKHVHPLHDSEPARWLVQYVKPEAIRQLNAPRGVEYWATITTRGTLPGFPLEWLVYQFSFRAPWKRGPALLRLALTGAQGNSEHGRKATAQQVRDMARRYGFMELDGLPPTWPVKPLEPGEEAKDRTTCGTCGRSWDDAIITSMTPAPAARCPFESWHKNA